MIFGSVYITGQAVQTHRDSYLLAHLTVVSVRRPFLGGGILFALGGSSFGFAFADLLYVHEMVGIAAFVGAALVCGWTLGQIRLLSRDLRGSELTGMIWGSYAHLNRLRRDIAAAMRQESIPDGRPS